ncbi:MAG: DNA gyrase subunit A [Bdellovibrionaceae bacterium]|nr:DNA gyrase subunit A [Pseudobdellovibrionaceae bacterium]|tara:strand:- start:118878 stop:121343 length:2466 start_codon:yes stop_codon:yes gene_type:complete
MEDTNTPSDVTQVDINKEMREAYMQYSMSVIVGRALPDVRDGLKPVHRRILFAMNDLGNQHNKPYKKSARIVGDVIGKYHPHGDMAVYDSMVRMAQDFSLRYPLVDGQGNFGSIDGDSPAAQRYTEVRMTRLAEELLKDIEKDTVTFQPNYDDSLFIPSVLPAKFPNLLANGSSGIAVGMATNIPPHNLDELIDGTIHLIENPEASIDDLMGFVKGPDFPTHGVISGTQGINSAYKKGRGVISIRAVAEIEPHSKDRERIVVTEIPYQVNKAKLIESMANLVRDKKVEGISDIRDESSREGMRIVIFLKKGENAQVILNRLYKYTQLQVSFGIIMLAIDSKNRPRMFNLKAMLEAFVEHRRDVVTRRCIYELKKAEARAHILEGLKKALDQIDEVIAAIRSSKETSIAKAKLVDQFSFTDEQAKAILEMRLQRLTGLEREKIENELNELMKTIQWLKKVLGDVAEIYKIIVEELKEVKERYTSPRRTKIEAAEDDTEDEDLIANEEMIVSLTNSGFIKRIPIEEYRLQKRGGKGLKGAKTRDEDFVWRIFAADTHTTLLTFSDRGKAYWTKVHRLPQGSRTARGKSIANVVNLSGGERAQAILPIRDFAKGEEANGFVVLLTNNGIIKKTALQQFSKPRPSGLIALTTDLEDTLIQAKLSTGTSDVLIATREGMSIRFDEGDVRAMGRTARGVKGITLGKEDRVVGMSVIPKDCKDTVLVVTEAGYGKRTPIEEYRTQSRGGVGIIAQKTTSKTGKVVTATLVSEDQHLMITTNEGQAIRMKCSDISTFGRNTQGVRLININAGERVTGVAVLDKEDDDEE